MHRLVYPPAALQSACKLMITRPITNPVARWPVDNCLAPSPHTAQTTRSIMTSTTRHFAYDPVPGSEIAGPTAGLYQRDIRNLFNLTLAERFGRLFFRAEIPPRAMHDALTQMLQICLNVDFEGFRKVTGHEDNVTNWFAVVHMHFWFFMRRLHREGIIGQHAYQRNWSFFWDVIESHLYGLKKDMPRLSNRVISKGMKNFKRDHEEACLLFERAVQLSDRHLAQALARVLFDNQEKINPESLLILIHYFRQQLAAVDRIPTEELFIKPNHKFPFLLPKESYDVKK